VVADLERFSSGLGKETIIQYMPSNAILKMISEVPAWVNMSKLTESRNELNEDLNEAKS